MLHSGQLVFQILRTSDLEAYTFQLPVIVQFSKSTWPNKKKDDSASEKF